MKRERFKSILAAYLKAEDVTSRRLYLETMEQVLKGVNKVIIDGKAGRQRRGALPAAARAASAGRASRGRATRRPSSTACREPRNEPASSVSWPSAAWSSALFLLLNALFTVHQTQQALVLQFGNPVRIVQRARAALEGAVHPAGRLFREARARLRRALGRAGPGRPEAARGRRLRPLPDHRSRCASASRSATRRRSAAGSSRSSSRACAACWARRRCSRSCRRTAPS